MDDAESRVWVLRLPRLPENIIAAIVVVDTRQHEEEIRQAIQIDDDLRIDRLAAGQCHDFALGAAADRPSQMAPGRRSLSTGEDKALQRAKARIQPINRLLQAIGLLGADAEMSAGFFIWSLRQAQIGAHIE